MSEERHISDDRFLACLSEKEREVVSGVLHILNASIEDEELRKNLIAMIILAVEDWGKERSN